MGRSARCGSPRMPPPSLSRADDKARPLVPPQPRRRAIRLPLLDASEDGLEVDDRRAIDRFETTD
ncbi:MAG TPA: hypothetical protein VJW23_06280, partial [Propionibacteriaceae bacterium]|nr:hypothetical protein [Propionibacteriaceae bacterium]